MASNSLNEAQFYTVLDRWRARRYDWHQANCCQFAADILQCWGESYSVPECATTDEAVTWLKSQGARSLYHMLVKLFGKPKPPLQGRRGWIVYRKGAGLDGAAIGTIDRKALFIGDTGLIEQRLSVCAFAFDPRQFRG